MTYVVPSTLDYITITKIVIPRYLIEITKSYFDGTKVMFVESSINLERECSQGRVVSPPYYGISKTIKRDEYNILHTQTIWALVTEEIAADLQKKMT